jgi:predicted transcriptional regulator
MDKLVSCFADQLEEMNRQLKLSHERDDDFPPYLQRFLADHNLATELLPHRIPISPTPLIKVIESSKPHYAQVYVEHDPLQEIKFVKIRTIYFARDGLIYIATLSDNVNQATVYKCPASAWPGSG